MQPGNNFMRLRRRQAPRIPATLLKGLSFRPIATLIDLSLLSLAENAFAIAAKDLGRVPRVLQGLLVAGDERFIIEASLVRNNEELCVYRFDTQFKLMQWLRDRYPEVYAAAGR